MLTKKVQDALNDQLNAELYSGYLYLAMSAYFEGTNLPGFGHWMRVQGQEELGHAMRFYDYICERRGAVALKAVNAPPAQWASPLAAFEDAYAHEQEVTRRIHFLLATAAAQKDPATQAFLQWFVNEQVEEEASADAIVQKLKLAGDSAGALLMLDKALSERGRGG